MTTIIETTKPASAEYRFSPPQREDKRRGQYVANIWRDDQLVKIVKAKSHHDCSQETQAWIFRDKHGLIQPGLTALTGDAIIEAREAADHAARKARREWSEAV
jgi:hypothetical protein